MDATVFTVGVVLLLIAVAGIPTSVVLALVLARLVRSLAHNARIGYLSLDVTDIHHGRNIRARGLDRNLDISKLDVFEMRWKARKAGWVGRWTRARIFNATLIVS
jgi:hypothetical protein